ncbi:hypothetical protein ACIQMR_35495 [Streptomyces sp. NPDC091376]|uniref:hypothetical protein n=1 Tax=Streptomyces sp. NPDC091376 TaxID=3365994 RepID=UPI0038023177
MNPMVMDLIRELGTDECIADMEAALSQDVVTVDTLTDEAPRRTGMHIDPSEHYDTRPVVRALKAMTDEALRRRIRFILDGGCAETRDEDGRLYQYSILITRERIARRLDI